MSFVDVLKVIGIEELKSVVVKIIYYELNLIILKILKYIYYYYLK
jgi:hypothetical protein